jgi:hypothetical protein
MDYDGVSVRPLVADDLDWVVDLAARRGEERQSVAPRFWRRAPDARHVHARYLGSLIEDPAVPAMRTDHVFAFGVHRPGILLVDDMAADRADRWATEGAALLRRLVGERRVRFVCPVHEPDRAVLAVELGLRCAETWWHRDLVEPPAVLQTDESLQVRGAQGRLVGAPPVYAPGGPVLFVTELSDRRALIEMEQQGASRGAAVSVVTQAPEDGVREELLLAAGYRRTCDFYEGARKAVHQGS